MLLLGTGIGLGVLLALPGLRRLEAAYGPPPERALAALRALPMFAPLGALALEQLARSAKLVEAPPDRALIREGVARELVRTVQEARKQAGLEVSDRIVLGVAGSGGVQAALDEHREYLMSETLAVEWRAGQADPLWKEDRRLDDETWTIEISRAGSE